ncbi:3854_t:CDS:2, partial [Gigaspora margarita]
DASNEESDLSDISKVDTNECIEYNDLLSDKPKDFENIFQEFLSKEYAEFMNIIMQFYVQDTFANAFIKFFNKYSNHNDCPLLSTSKAGLEYALEFKTVLDGIHQILLNNSITEEFVIEYKMSTDKVFSKCQYSDMFDSNWWKNVEQNIPIGAHVMPIIIYSDATQCNRLDKTSKHPVFIILGNIPLTRRNKVDTKVLLDYIPSLEHHSTSENILPNFEQQHINFFIRHLQLYFDY